MVTLTSTWDVKDGSACGGILDEGAVTSGKPTSSDVVKILRRKGTRFTRSYEDEKWVLDEAALQMGVSENYF